MSHTASMSTFPQPGVEDRVLPANPFYSLRYHFGMLLGVEDFETEQAYHRGKNRLHNAWLHRDGVVWGLDVAAPTNQNGVSLGEIAVSPGLALDAAGNELHLDASMCVDVGKWYEDRKTNKDFSADDEHEVGGKVVATFDAHVVAQFSACLLRPVPALMEPCEGSGNDTAYSRAFETVELLLLPGLPTAPEPPMPYHRLRLLFGLEDAQVADGQIADADKRVLVALDEVSNAAEQDRPRMLLKAFRWCAALDVIDLQGADEATRGASRYPVDNRPPVLLSTLRNVAISRAGQDTVWTLDRATIDNTVRHALVATGTIQELLCGALVGDIAGADAGGPRVDPASVSFANDRFEFTTTKPLAPKTVMTGIAVLSFEPNGGWSPRTITSVDYDPPTRHVVAHLAPAPAGEMLRLVVRGTGGAPVLGDNLIPFAGAIGGKNGTEHEGVDFTFMLDSRS